MKYFARKIILPYIAESGYTRICEIGALHGATTDHLLKNGGCRITVVDPCLSADLGDKYNGNRRIEIFRGLSLDYLARTGESFDCILIDGDHNWYTVYNELKLIHERKLLADGGSILLHDVCWPYARRDMYYQPETIPREFRHPCAKAGIIDGQSALSPGSGLNADVFNAEFEGGSRNGVLNAVEDFLSEHRGDYSFFMIKKEFGLAFIAKNAGRRAASKKYRRKAGLLNFKQRLKHILKRPFASLGG